MGTLKVVRYARLHSMGAGASVGGPEGPGSASKDIRGPEVRVKIIETRKPPTSFVCLETPETYNVLETGF